MAVMALTNVVVSLLMGLRVVAVGEWILRLGAGDLDYRTTLGGKDEVAQLCRALEKLRDRSVRVVKLQLVERMTARLEQRNAELRETIEGLERAQDQIVAQRKAAELGELTAGVAHEIRIPLKSVKRSTERARELVSKMVGAVGEHRNAVEAQAMEAIEEIETDIEEDLELAVAYARRADSIVDRMLMLGTAQGALESVSLNDLVGEHARLACRAAEQTSGGIGVRLEEAYDDAVGTVTVVTQGIARIVLNIVGNACYAVNESGESEAQGREPTIWMSTRRNPDGIDEAILDKVMNPFLTTKPPQRRRGPRPEPVCGCRPAAQRDDRDRITSRRWHDGAGRAPRASRKA